jgi:pSer/pThr/pTyr-binding forkhead associated (FHA) protein
MAFPFRVGRESRPEGRVADAPSPFQRPSRPPNNELYLREPGHVLNVSREHFLIDAQDGEYVLVDRGSVCGTLVEGDQIGSQRKGGSTPLSDQDVIVVGTSESRYIFKFVVLDAV